MSFKAIRNAALAATFLVGSAAVVQAQTSTVLGTGGSSAGGWGGGSASTLGVGGATAPYRNPLKAYL